MFVMTRVSENFESILLIEFEGMWVKCWGHVAGCDMIFGELMTG